MTTPEGAASLSSLPQRVAACSLLVCWVGIIWMRVSFDAMPYDLASYVAAADLFWSGADPYDVEQLVRAERGSRFLFIYPPLSLWLLWPLAVLTSSSVILIEALARALCVVYIARSLCARFSLTLHPVWALCLLSTSLTLISDASAGNVATYLVAAWLWLASVSTWTPKRLLACSLLGVLFSIKPMWLLPVGATLVARGQPRRALLALGAGASLHALFTLYHWPLTSRWLDVVSFHTSYYGRFELWISQPWWTFALLACAWGFAALWLLRQDAASSWRWVWAGTSVVIWPRSGLYDDLLLLPALCWLATILQPSRAALLWLAAWALPWALLVLHLHVEHPMTRVFWTLRLLTILFVAGLFIIMRRTVKATP
jgi:hypothetical protein